MKERGGQPYFVVVRDSFVLLMCDCVIFASKSSLPQICLEILFRSHNILIDSNSGKGEGKDWGKTKQGEDLKGED